jgi:hypothetical protein
MEAARPPGEARLQRGKALTDGGTTEAGRRDSLARAAVPRGRSRYGRVDGSVCANNMRETAHK